MASKFEIFEDQENFDEKSKYGELKRDKSKFMPLASKDFGIENINEQVIDEFYLFAAKSYFS